MSKDISLAAGVALALGVLCPSSFWAADQAFDIKPGLWDVTNTVQMTSPPPMPDMKSMTAEQRARIEATVKNMSGPHTSTTKACVTRDGIDKAIARASSTPSNSCAPRLVNSSSSKVELHIDCTQERGTAKSSGDVTIDRKDYTHFTGSGSMKSAGVNGRPVDMKWTMSGAYVSPDCGQAKK